MYLLNDYGQYEKISKKYPIRNINYSETETKVNNPKENFIMPIQTRNVRHFRPIFKMNSQNYIKEEKLLMNEIAENNSYIIPVNRGRNNLRNRLFCNCSIMPIPTLTQNKFHYNNRVIILKRSINNILNYNNNSIHFIKSTSKNKINENKIESYNNKRIVFLTNKNSKNKNVSRNNMVTNNINNYNIIKIEKKFVNKNKY